MTESRRAFLKILGLAAGGLPGTSILGAHVGCYGGSIDQAVELPSQTTPYAYVGPPGPETLFSHGVASGDPLQDAVILWTRLSPYRKDRQVRVHWEVARDESFAQVVRSGWAEALWEKDFTVKVDATGLEAGRGYFYRFRAQGQASTVGRTKTLPARTDQVRLGVTSCSSYVFGYFNVYASLAAHEELDVVLHLGDYIYEYAQSGTLFADGAQISAGALASRRLEPLHETITLGDYRTRYALYRRDPDLQALHARHPMICIWDDHESANNAWLGGAGNHTEETEGAWEARRAASIQAYFEWLPIREGAEPGQIWRAFEFGDLVDLAMLDTRQWGRQEQVEVGSKVRDRELLGREQEAWLQAQMTTSKAAWHLLGQQVMMGQLELNGPVNPDQWDGYPEARERLFKVIETLAPGSVVVLTGDIHTSWAMELARTPKDPETYDKATSRGALAVEFVTPSVTSPGLDQVSPVVLQVLRRYNPHVKWVDLERRGYMVVEVTRAHIQSTWYHLDTVTSRTFTATEAAVWHVRAGEAVLREGRA